MFMTPVMICVSTYPSSAFASDSEADLSSSPHLETDGHVGGVDKCGVEVDAGIINGW